MKEDGHSYIYTSTNSTFQITDRPHFLTHCLPRRPYMSDTIIYIGATSLICVPTLSILYETASGVFDDNTLDFTLYPFNVPASLEHNIIY